jgi:hypothetical protein
MGCPVCCGGLPPKTFCTNCGSLFIRIDSDDLTWSLSEEGRAKSKENEDKILKRLRDAMDEIEKNRKGFEGEGI